MKNAYTLYGWRLSYFTAKVRTYLQYKGIAFVEEAPSLYTLRGPIKRHTGDVVMPVVVTPEGEWLQDSSVIIDTLERRHPANPVVPATPVQRIASYLLETWADEFWMLSSPWSQNNGPVRRRVSIGRLRNCASSLAIEGSAAGD